MILWAAAILFVIGSLLDSRRDLAFRRERGLWHEARLEELLARDTTFRKEWQTAKAADDTPSADPDIEHHRRMRPWFTWGTAVAIWIAMFLGGIIDPLVVGPDPSIHVRVISLVAVAIAVYWIRILVDAMVGPVRRTALARSATVGIAAVVAVLIVVPRILG